MNSPTYEDRLTKMKRSLLALCYDSGILMVENLEASLDANLIEGGLVDSLGVVCLQDQIETRYNVEISQEQFVAELHTLSKIAGYLATHSPEQVPA